MADKMVNTIFKTPATTPSLSWFEFLLDPQKSQLQKHLDSGSKDPSPLQLCQQFLEKSVAPQISQQGRESANRGENQRSVHLKTLALVVACNLQWKLPRIEEGLSLSLQQSLMLELLKRHNLTPESNLNDIKWEHLPLQELMALILFHRWILHVVCKSKNSLKATKLTSNNGGKDIADETVVRKAQNLSSSSAEILSMLVPCEKDLTLPMFSQSDPIKVNALNDIGNEDTVLLDEDNDDSNKEETMKEAKELLPLISMALEKPDVEMKEETSQVVTVQKVDNVSDATISCHLVNAEISYDLGCYYFANCRYDLSLKYFKMATDSKNLLPPSIDFDCGKKLEGFLTASLAMNASNINIVNSDDLWTKVQSCLQGNTKDLIDILLEDNKAHSISIENRFYLERYFADKDSTLLFSICTCNAIRCVMEGEMIDPYYLYSLKNVTMKELGFLAKVVRQQFSNETAYNNKLSRFVRTLSLYLGNDQQQFLYSASPLFSNMILSQPTGNTTENRRSSTSSQSSMHGSSLDSEPRISLFQDRIDGRPLPAADEKAYIQKQLLTTNDPLVISQLVGSLHSIHGGTSNTLGMELNIYRHIICDIHDAVAADSLHILLFKARNLCIAKNYSLSLGFLSIVMDVINKYMNKTSPGPHIARMKNILHQERLWVEICREQNNNSVNANIDIIRRCKACYHHQNQDPPPGKHLCRQLVSYLLNLREWEFLKDENGSYDSSVNDREIGFCIGSICGGIQRGAEATRSYAKGLWNAVLQLCPPNQTLSSHPTVRHHPMEQDNSVYDIRQKDFIDFVNTIKDEMALTVLISCFATLLNVAKDSPKIILSTPFSNFWPSSLDNTADAPHFKSVIFYVDALIERALSIHSESTVFIRLAADSAYIKGHYRDALHHYLELGAMTTKYFNEPVSENVWNDQLIRYMITCCMNLKLFTHVVVLCQFLPIVDYSIAFKALQENVTTDASDALYSCIWDVTILEYIIFCHSKRGEADKKKTALKEIERPEINSCNGQDVLKQTSTQRKRKFLRSFCRYIWN